MITGTLVSYGIIIVATLVVVYVVHRNGLP